MGDNSCRFFHRNFHTFIHDLHSKSDSFIAGLEMWLTDKVNLHTKYRWKKSFFRSLVTMSMNFEKGCSVFHQKHWADIRQKGMSK